MDWGAYRREKERLRRPSVVVRQDPVNWDSPSLDSYASLLQAGWAGMKQREKFRKVFPQKTCLGLNKYMQVEAMRGRLIELKNVEIEKRLGINFGSKEVQNAITSIQAGFRGVQARKSLKDPATSKFLTPEEKKLHQAATEIQARDLPYFIANKNVNPLVVLG